MRQIINRVTCTRPAEGGRRGLGCTTISLLSSYTGREFWTPPPKLPAERATAARTVPVAANDNRPMSGKAARQWPALQRARNGTLFDGERDNRLAAVVLESFAHLYAETALDPEAIPSPAGALLDLSIGLADLPEGEMGEDGSYGGVDRIWENPCTPERLVALYKAGRLRWVAGAQEPYRVQDKRGRWHVLPMDGFRRSRGPAPRKTAKALTAQPSQSATAPRAPHRPQEARLIAMEEIQTIRRRMDADAWAGLVAIAVEKATARQLGERAGLTFKRAEALGGELMRKYTEAAIAAFQLPEAANDNIPVNAEAA